MAGPVLAGGVMTGRKAAAALALLVLLGANPASGADPAKPAPSRTGFDVANIDRSVDPCDDFYQYACGGWLARNPPPPDQPRWHRGAELALRNRESLRVMLEEAASAQGPKRDAIDQKLGDAYASCMDEAGIEALGSRPLQPDLDRIAALRTKQELGRAVARLHGLGVGVLFGFSSERDYEDTTKVIGWLDQGGLGLPDRDYYLKDDPKSVEMRKAYAAHVERMLGLLGESSEAAAASARAVLEIETALAKASVDRLTRREPSKLYHLKPRQELSSLAPAFAWEAYLSEVKAPAFGKLNVAAPEFVAGMSAALQSVDLDAWKAYLRWHLVHASAAVLPAVFVAEDFAFYGKTLTGAREIRPRWRRCVQALESQLSEALGRRYVSVTFGWEGKRRTLRMVAALEAALERDIDELPWMTEATKKQAVVKLRAIANKIGYPDRWRDYGRLKIVRGDALGNSQRASLFAFQRALAKIGKRMDRGEWPFPPTTVNAGYNPLLNEIVFPAAILQPPYYEIRMDDAVNFGAIGAVIGHELTHGFDDEGRKFDAQGRLRNWWTEEDSREFEKRASCLVDQYAGYTAVADVRLNGKLTLGENTADNGGVRIAYQALVDARSEREVGPIDGFSPEQRFFLGFGQIACENRTDEVARMMAQVGTHSPNRFRINGVVSNMPEFQRAFGCKAGAPMVRETVCKVW